MEKLHPGDAKRAREALARQLTEGMPEQQFWATFAQCFVCKAVTLRKDFATSHGCKGRDHRGHPYAHRHPETPTPHSTGSISEDEDDVAEILSSPAPTDTDFDDTDELDIGGVEYVFLDRPAGSTIASALSAGTQDVPQDATMDGDNVSAQSDGVPSVLSSDIELPTIMELLRERRSRHRLGHEENA